MTELQRVILIALGLLAALCAIVSLTLRRAIGGVLENVAREEEESGEEESGENDAERDQSPSARQENET